MTRSQRKRRLDEELASRGLFSSADEAARAVLAGLVSGRGERYSSPATLVEAGAYLHIKGESDRLGFVGDAESGDAADCFRENTPSSVSSNRAQHFVSRGGNKLKGAFDAWRDQGLSAASKDCIDIGCSTGGFTDCLLQEGAKSVAAIDVGYAQFDWGLRQDERVRVFERTNIVDFARIPEHQHAFTFATVDVSFTSIAHIIDSVVCILAKGADGIFLVKPQFELARHEVERGGLVRDEELRKKALCQVEELLCQKGFVVKGSTPSPLKGAKGNQEYLLWAQKY